MKKKIINKVHGFDDCHRLSIVIAQVCNSAHNLSTAVELDSYVSFRFYLEFSNRIYLNNLTAQMRGKLFFRPRLLTKAEVVPETKRSSPLRKLSTVCL